MSSTYKELKQQYPALERTIDYINGKFNDIGNFILKTKPKKIVFLGCGSSFNIAESLAVTTQIYMNLPSFAIAAGDLMLHVKGYEGFLADSLIVAISRSGSTSEMILAVKALKVRLNSPLLSIVCTEKSELSECSDISVEMPWAFDESICQTRTVSCLYMAGTLLISKLSENAGLERDLNRVVALGQKYMECYKGVFKNVSELSWDSAVILGDSELAGIAGEGALAFKEICQLQSNYYHMLDSRHGPFVMIRKNTLVIVIMSDPDNTYEIDLINNLAEKGATVLCYSDVEPTGLDRRVVKICFGEPLQHAARGIPFILIAQMTAYYKAVTNGINPDNPDGLSAWIKL